VVSFANRRGARIDAPGDTGCRNAGVSTISIAPSQSGTLTTSCSRTNACSSAMRSR
jgi:hypothetical protein